MGSGIRRGHSSIPVGTDLMASLSTRPRSRPGSKVRFPGLSIAFAEPLDYKSRPLQIDVRANYQPQDAKIAGANGFRGKGSISSSGSGHEDRQDRPERLAMRDQIPPIRRFLTRPVRPS